MSNIAIIKKDLPSLGQGGGLEKATRRIVDAFQQKGSHVTLLTTGSPSGYRALTCQLKSYFKFRRLIEFDNWCQKTVQSQSFDVILSMDRASLQTHHRAGNGVHAAYLALRQKYEGLLRGWTFPINPLHQTILKLEKATFEDPRLRGIIVNSHLVRRQILEFYSTSPDKIHVVHNGVEWQEMESDFNTAFVSKHQIAKELGLKIDCLNFLFVGHNFQRKGLTPLLYALSHLQNKNFHLSVVGTDKNPNAFRKLCQQLDLSQHVTFFGPQPSLRPFYQVADALVLPSLYDPFANVTVEALAMGLFVITSSTNGGHEVLTKSSGITLETPHSVEELTAALTLALNKTLSSAQTIRSSVQHLDFTGQLGKVCQICC